MTAMPPIAVLAGGVASRMMPLTRLVPKSLLAVAGEPFIAHQLRLFRREGVAKVVLCVGHLSEEIEAFVGDGRAFGVEVAYSHDGSTRLGTGGAVRKALPLLGDEFMVIYGDSYLDIEFRPVMAAFRASGKLGLMTVLHNRGRWDTSNIEFTAGRIVAHSKRPTERMAHIDFGLSVLSREALAGHPSDSAFDLSEVYGELVEAGQLAGYEVTRRFYEIGSHAGLQETADYIVAMKAKAHAS
jgi:NDP-sugar pyrophosphorylase family protein